MKIERTLITLALVSIGLNGIAQSDQVSPKKMEARESRTELSPEQKSERVTARMTEKLGLNAMQQTKVKELTLGIAMKNDALRNDASLTPEQKKERIRMNLKAGRAHLYDMLDADQKIKLERWEAEKKEAKKEKMEEKREAKKAAAETEADDFEKL